MLDLLRPKYKWWDVDTDMPINTWATPDDVPERVVGVEFRSRPELISLPESCSSILRQPLTTIIMSCCNAVGVKRFYWRVSQLGRGYNDPLVEVKTGPGSVTVKQDDQSLNCTLVVENWSPVTNQWFESKLSEFRQVLELVGDELTLELRAFIDVILSPCEDTDDTWVPPLTTVVDQEIGPFALVSYAYVRNSIIDGGCAQSWPSAQEYDRRVPGGFISGDLLTLVQPSVSVRNDGGNEQRVVTSPTHVRRANGSIQPIRGLLPGIATKVVDGSGNIISENCTGGKLYIKVRDGGVSNYFEIDLDADYADYPLLPPDPPPPDGGDCEEWEVTYRMLLYVNLPLPNGKTRLNILEGASTVRVVCTDPLSLTDLIATKIAEDVVGVSTPLSISSKLIGMCEC
jgi:hypothetical protein